MKYQEKRSREAILRAFLEPRNPECGKIRYESRGKAKTAMRRLIKDGVHTGKRGVLNAYRCNRCAAWHIGHANPKREMNT